MNVRQHLVSSLAGRLAPLVEGAASVLVRAEPEHLPVEVAAAVAGRVADRVVRLQAGGAVASTGWAADVRTTDCLLIKVGEDDDPGEALLAVSRATAEHGAVPVVVVAGTSDRTIDDALRGLFQVSLGRDSLLVTDADLIALGDDWTEVDRRTELLAATYGVPALVEAGIETIEAGGEGYSLAVDLALGTWARMGGAPAGPLKRVAAVWAERITPVLLADDVALVRYLVPAVRARWLSEVASAVLDREVTDDEARATDTAPGILAPTVVASGPPPVLASEVITRLLSEHPARAATLRQRLVARLAAPDDDPDAGTALPPELVLRALVRLKAWGALDAHLDRHAEVVALLTDSHRRVLRATLPVEIPASWQTLRAVQEYVSFERLPVSELPIPLEHLVWTTTLIGERHLTPFTRAVRDHMMAAQSQFQVSGVEAAIPLYVRFRDWVMEEVARLHEEAVKSFLLPSRTMGEAKIALMLLLGTADVSLAFGRMADSVIALKQAERLADAFTIYADESAVPILGLRARLALVAARSGLVDQARDLLAAYEDAVQTAGTREWEPEEIVEAARRYLAAASPAPVRPTADVDERSHSASYEIEAEALLILTQRGPDPAIEWLHTFLGRTRWTDLSPFFWWPLHELLALIQLREGDVAAARAAVDGQAIPEESSLLIEAAAAFDGDDRRGCLALLRRAMAVPDASPRTMLIAAAYRVGALAGLGEDVAAEVETHAEGWRSNPSTVALLPEPVRAQVIGVLEPSAAEQAGLRLSGGGGARPLPLTPRQTDVLRLLADGRTLPEIAEELFLGVETVRSTSKALYKRLGVHDRGAAVRVGIASGVIAPGRPVAAPERVPGA